MGGRIFVSGLLCVGLVSACALRGTTQGRAIGLVEDVIAGEEPGLSAILRAYAPGRSDADIVIVDDPLRAAMLSDAFLAADAHDNIDGSGHPDRLPDFAGERIVSQFDLRGVYDAELPSDSVLRETAVRALFAAMDTVCHANAYDSLAASPKRPAKMVVFASPGMAAAARSDIDTLLGATGVSLPVLYPAHDMLRAAKDAGCRNVAVISDMPSAASYLRIMEDIGADFGLYFVNVDSIGSQGILAGMLEAYHADGRRSPIDCVVADTYGTDGLRLRDEYAGILLGDADTVPLGRMLAEGCAFLSVSGAVTEVAHAVLRERNLFTHNISYPKAAAYMTIPGSASYALMQMDWGALPVGLENDIMTEASQTYVSYVQD